MTEHDLARLAELEKAATPGPWSVVDPPWGEGTVIVTGTGDPHGQFVLADFLPMEDEAVISRSLRADPVTDAHFLVALRNAAPALLAHIRDLEHNVTSKEVAERGLIEQRDRLTQERDDADAEVERLREALEVEAAAFDHRENCHECSDAGECQEMTILMEHAVALCRENLARRSQELGLYGHAEPER